MSITRQSPWKTQGSNTENKIVTQHNVVLQSTVLVMDHDVVEATKERTHVASIYVIDITEDRCPSIHVSILNHRYEC